MNIFNNEQLKSAIETKKIFGDNDTFIVAQFGYHPNKEKTNKTEYITDCCILKTVKRDGSIENSINTLNDEFSYSDGNGIYNTIQIIRDSNDRIGFAAYKGIETKVQKEQVLTTTKLSYVLIHHIDDEKKYNLIEFIFYATFGKDGIDIKVLGDGDIIYDSEGKKQKITKTVIQETSDSQEIAPMDSKMKFDVLDKYLKEENVELDNQGRVIRYSNPITHISGEFFYEENTDDPKGIIKLGDTPIVDDTHKDYELNMYYYALTFDGTEDVNNKVENVETEDMKSKLDNILAELTDLIPKDINITTKYRFKEYPDNYAYFGESESTEFTYFIRTIGNDYTIISESGKGTNITNVLDADCNILIRYSETNNYINHENNTGLAYIFARNYPDIIHYSAPTITFDGKYSDDNELVSIETYNSYCYTKKDKYAYIRDNVWGIPMKYKVEFI